MIYNNSGFVFSASPFPRAPDRQELIHVPLSLSVNPFDSSTTIINKKLNECSKCKSYLFQKYENGPTPTLPKKCAFCGAQSNFVIYHSPPYVEWVDPTIKPSIPITLLLIDASQTSKSSGFFEAVIANLPNSFPNGFSNFLVASFNKSGISFLTPSQKVHVYPVLDDIIEVPPSFLYNSVPNSFFNLYKKTPISPSFVNIKEILGTALKIVGVHGRVVMFLSTPPLGFHPSPANFDLCPHLFSVNFNPEWQNLQNLYLANFSRVDFLISYALVNAFDLVAFYKFVEPMHSNIFIMNNTQFNQITEIMNNIIDSFIIFVKILFPTNLRCEGMYQSSASNQLNCVSFAMNSKWCNVVNFEMVKMGPKQLPFQVIISYRKYNGEAAMRVFSEILESTDDMAGVFEGLNQSVILKSIVNQIICEEYKNKKVTDIKKLLESTLHKMSPFLRGYQNHVAIRNNGANDLILPNSIKKLPVLCLGCLKSSAFSFGTLSNERIFYIDQMEHANLEELMQMCYPTLTDTTVYLMENGELSNYVLNKLMLDSTRIYTLFDGFSTWIWVGKKINIYLLKQLFGVDEIYQLNDIIQALDTEESKKFFFLLKKDVRLCIENEIGHQSFMNRLVEDPTINLPALSQYLALLQKEILTS